jgi:hypothetical protein
MSKLTFVASALGAGLMLAGSMPALADISNGPNPYGAAYGFDTPTQASWADWDRGDTGTLYAEWDDFSGGSSASTLPDVGVSGTSSAVFSYLAPTFAASSGNLYNFASTEMLYIDVDSSDLSLNDTLTIALQTETQGGGITNVTLDGMAADSSTVTYLNPAYNSPFGPTALTQTLYLWTLSDLPLDGELNFYLEASVHTSIAQVSLDAGSIAPAPVPVPAAVWLMGSALLGLFGVSRSGVSVA